MRRFTTVEIALAVSLVGIIAAVTIPTFVHEMHASRFVEPIEGLERIGIAAVAEATAHDGQYPATAPLTPAMPPRGRKEVDPPGTWETSPTWRALANFRATPEGVPHAYSFAFDGNGSSFIAHTHGDLDGDGLLSTFEIRSKAATAVAPTPSIEPGMYVEAELNKTMMKIRAAHVAGFVTVALACLGIRSIQPELQSELHAAKKELKGPKSKQSDVYLAPPPTMVRASTFGYRAAAADLLWANLALEYGMHWQEKRAFPDITRHIDVIIAIEPDHPTLFHFVDTMILFTPVGGHEEEARTARRYLELGIAARPHDADLWLRYGQFLAFLAPSFLKDEAEIERWRLDGAREIIHAVELGADAHRALAALTILRKAGSTKMAHEILERVYGLTDDSDLREQLILKARQLGETMVAADAATSIVENEWRSRYSFLSRTSVVLIGPYRVSAACAGSAPNASCPSDWSAKLGQ